MIYYHSTFVDFDSVPNMMMIIHSTYFHFAAYPLQGPILNRGFGGGLHHMHKAVHALDLMLFFI